MSDHQTVHEESGENRMTNSNEYRRSKKTRGFLCNLGLCSNSQPDDIDIFACVPDLIRQKKWKKLGKTLNLIEKKAGGHMYSASLPQDLLCMSGGRIGEEEENCLHLACRHRAPFSTIQRLCAISPELPFETTKRDDRTPLHVAVSIESVSVEIVDFLISLDAGAPCRKDLDGCTPLHIICRFRDDDTRFDSYEDPFITYPILAIREEVSLVVRTLCDVHPWCINDEDNFDMTPIEYAVQSNLDFNIIKHMWSISSSQWKKHRECIQKFRRASHDLQICIRREQILREKIFPAWDTSTDDMSDDSSSSLAGLVLETKIEIMKTNNLIELI